jgi:hypothetical protein
VKTSWTKTYMTNPSQKRSLTIMKEVFLIWCLL